MNKATIITLTVELLGNIILALIYYWEEWSAKKEIERAGE